MTPGSLASTAWVLLRAHARTYARTQPRAEELERAKARYALCAALTERYPASERIESLRLAALRDVLRARCGA